MNKVFLLSFTLFVSTVTACQPVRQPTDNPMVEPGDEIDGMVITNGTADAPALEAFCSPALENDRSMTVQCQVPPLPRLAIGRTFGKLGRTLQDLDWSLLTWELYLDKHLLDLAAFGLYDYVVPDLAESPSPIREIFRQVRAWDVILLNPTSGRHRLHGTAYDEANAYTWTVIFTVQASDRP
jgi:hypothetical protein